MKVYVTTASRSNLLDKKKLDLLIALTKCSAKLMGFWLSFFASSKQSEEASCPNSEFGGLSKGKVSTLISGRDFFKACAKAVSHSLRNSARGFSEIMRLLPVSIVR